VGSVWNIGAAQGSPVPGDIGVLNPAGRDDMEDVCIWTRSTRDQRQWMWIGACVPRANSVSTVACGRQC